jgi:hypothetical protein
MMVGCDGCEIEVVLSELFIFIFFVCHSSYMNYFNFLSKYSLPCVLNDMFAYANTCKKTPVVIKAEEAAKLYNTMRNSHAHEIDHEVQLKDWLHPADSVRITEQNDEHATQIFTDSSKSEHGVGAGVAIFIQNKLVHQSRYTLHKICSNNQAEQLAIVKALQITGKLYNNDKIPEISNSKHR